jgi:hypothetical protein
MVDIAHPANLAHAGEAKWLELLVLISIVPAHQVAAAKLWVHCNARRNAHRKKMIQLIYHWRGSRRSIHTPSDLADSRLRLKSDKEYSADVRSLSDKIFAAPNGMAEVC